MNFPLFDTIVAETDKMPQESTKCSLSHEQFCNYVKGLDDEGYELMYGLIKSYEMKENNDKSSFVEAGSLPFHGKKSRGHIRFDVRHIPERLYRMLVYFVLKHEAKRKEDDELRVNTALCHTIES